MIVTPIQLKEVLNSTIKAKLPVLIVGAPGIGKTDIIKAATTDCRADLIIKHPVVDEPTDYKGLPFREGKTAEFLPYGDLNSLMIAKKLTVCFFDDFGQAAESVQKALMQLLLARELNGKKISPHIVFVAATNRRQDRAGVNGILEPVKSRFACILELKPDYNNWSIWASNADIDEDIQAFISLRQHYITETKVSSDIVNNPSPRTIANLDKLIKAGVPKGCEYAMYSGACGEAFATEFLGFIQFKNQLPPISEIIKNPLYDIPNRLDIVYVVLSVLAKKANKNNIESIITFAKRWPKDLQVFSLKLCQKYGGDIVTENKSFINWATSL